MLAEALLELGRQLHLDLPEADLVARFLAVVGRVLPGRALAVRVLDPRTAEPARAYVAGGELRPAIGDEPITVREAAIAGSGMKSAVAASARIRIAARWDSPFHHVATGFAVPLVAAGELYGAFDVGYPPAAAADPAADEKLVLPLANQLAVALR